MAQSAPARVKSITDPKTDIIVRQRHPAMSEQSVRARVKSDRITGDVKLHFSQGTLTGVTLEAIAKENT